MSRRHLACAALAAWVTTAPAAEFSWELSGGVAQGDVGTFSETDTATLAATHYFEPIDDTNGPFALAAFYDPAPRLSLALERNERRSKAIAVVPEPIVPPPSSVTVEESDDYRLSGRHVLPDSRWFFGGHYSEDDVDRPVFFERRVETTTSGVGGGKYLGDATTLGVEVEHRERTDVQPFVFCVADLFCSTAGRLTSDVQTDTVRVEALHVRRARVLTYALFGRIEQSKSDAVIRTPAFSFPVLFPAPVFGPADGPTIPARTTELDLGHVRTYSVGSELFPTPKLGIRIAYTRSSAESSTDGYDAAATWFFRRNVGVQFSFAQQEAGVPNIGAAETASIRFIGRL